MFPYWALFCMLALGSIAFHRFPDPRTGIKPVDHRIRDNPLFIFALMVIAVMIGFRYQIGGDWVPYQVTFRSVTSLPFSIAVSRTVDEAGYTIVNWIAGQVGGGMWLVNLICAIPCIVGLAAFSLQQPNPWLALLAATPLFIVVVCMGYTRQAVATGFMLIGIAGVTRGRSFLWFVAWTLVASTFHTSALFYIPVVALIMFRASMAWLIVLVTAAAAFYFLILPAALERYSIGYIKSVYEAKGAAFRIVPNALAGIALLGFPKQLLVNDMEVKIWRGWAMLSLLALITFFFIRSSVIIDRLSLYLLPLQILVLSRLPTAFTRDGERSVGWTGAVIVYSAAVLFLWLSYAYNSHFWVPYRFYPLG